jgi:glutamine phosphoribosylpyrophosphate amidotransferase
MCAVIGVYAKNPSIEDLILYKQVILESSIRGLHATGASWIKNGEIVTVIRGGSAARYLKDINLRDCINEDGNLYFVGHCRYSTSDLLYNQPLYSDNFSIVHNGVVSQEMPERWEELYGYKCKTGNDSELIVHTLEAGKSPLEEFPDSSMAVVELHKEKRLRFYRNGKRPIYFTSTKNSVIITSTADIALRAGIESASQVPMNTYVTVNSDMSLSMHRVDTGRKDLQNV